MTRLFASISAAIVVAGLGWGSFVVWKHNSQSQCRGSAIAGGSATIGGPFILVDHTGKTVSEKDVITDLSLIYFGFTYCPDICPLDTARNAEAVDILAENGIDITPVFITIDPERDTPEVLADHVSVIHPNMIGLTGSADQISAASKAYKTYYRKNGDGEDYLMDHSTFSYLVSPDGFLDFFRRDATPEEVAEKIACYAGASL